LDSNSDRKQITDESPGPNALARIITEEIRRSRDGAISFARFMELALYHPDYGYYNRSQPIIGKSGDFYTSVSVGPLFGQLLAHFLDSEGIKTIVEAGANDGSLARDILKANPHFDYFIVEPSAVLRAKQRATLASFNKVAWHDSIDKIPPIRGAIISNELLDAFPCHRLQWTGANWIELGVAENLQFAPIAAQTELPPALAELQPHLPKSFIVEHAPAAAQWWRAAAEKLERGLMLAVDYGDEEHGLWTPNRPHGTLRAYKDHHLADDPLAHPGEQDLTAHVNFSPLIEAGEAQGLQTESLQSQSRFLTKLATEIFKSTPPTPSQLRQLQTLIHPIHLGASFKVLIQRRA
jgi:SAM-dependent MidA family methyltransferase